MLNRKKVVKWICSDNSSHVFDEPTPDYFCPYEPPYHGFLREVIVIIDEKGKVIGDDDLWDEPVSSMSELIRPLPPTEVSLTVLLMNASSSMSDPVFESIQLSRNRLIATSAASGIFDMERMQSNPNAYVATFKLDDRVELMFMDTVANLINRFDKDVRKFSNYIYDELFKMQQGCDINRALQYTYDWVGKFLKRQLSELPLKHDPLKAFSIPNIRVLMYTAGRQYNIHGDRKLHPNPFKEQPLTDLNHDVLLGAYLGQESDEGCTELKSLLSNCPLHGIPQFFLFDSPAQIPNLKYLFRMAVSASGFCPKCLERQLNR